MSGTLEISEQEAWMPAGWVYDNVLESLGKVLAAQAPELAGTITQGVTTASGGFLSLKSLGRAEIQRVLDALRAVRQTVVERGARAFANPTFYPGYVAQIDELIAMLSRDHRMTAG